MEWTEARVAMLRKLWEHGRSASQIAQEMGDVSRNAIIGKAHRLGLESRPSPIRRAPARAPRPQPAPQRPQRQAAVGGRQCQWPIGHPREPDFHFCGAAAEPDRPYCEEHCTLAYRRSDNSAA